MLSHHSGAYHSMYLLSYVSVIQFAFGSTLQCFLDVPLVKVQLKNLHATGA